MMQTCDHLFEKTRWDLQPVTSIFQGVSPSSDGDAAEPARASRYVGKGEKGGSGRLRDVEYTIRPHHAATRDGVHGSGHSCPRSGLSCSREADECAHKMIDLYRDMIRYSDNAQQPLQIVDRPAVPPVSVKSG